MKKKLLFALGLLALLLFTYGNSLYNPFLIDDITLVKGNYLIGSLSRFPQMFCETYLDSYYRPLATVSLGLNYLVNGLDPVGYHLANILFHFVNSLLLFVLLNSLFKNFSLAGLTTLLFAVHPINSVCVNYISDRGNLLGALFMLISLILFRRSLLKGKWLSWFGGLLAFVAALLSRESSILMPLYFLCLWLPLTKEERPATKRIILTFSILAMFSVVYFVLLNRMCPLTSAMLARGPKLFSWLQIKAFFLMMMHYLLLFAGPYKILFFREVFKAASLPGVIGVCLFITGVTVAVIKNKAYRSRLLWFGAAWFLVGVAPLYRLLLYRPEIGYVMQDSWIYFSGPGLLLLLAAVLLYLRRFVRPELYKVFMALLVIFLVNQTLGENLRWHDVKTYCRYWLKEVPDNPLAFNTLAREYTKEKEYERAELLLLRSLELTKSRKRIIWELHNLSLVYIWKGEPDKAIKYARKSLKMQPKTSLGYYILGRAYQDKGETQKAINMFRRQQLDNFSHPLTHQFLMEIYEKQGRERLARAEKILSLYFQQFYPAGEPELWRQKAIDELIMLGLKSYKDGDRYEALEIFRLAVQLEPNGVLRHNIKRLIRKSETEDKLTQRAQSVNIFLSEDN